MNKLIQSGLQIVERIRDEAKTATRSWTLVEAYIGRDQLHRENLRQGLSRAGLAMTSNVIVKALARDVLSALFRATDERRQNRFTLCALVSLLEEPSAREAIDDYIRAEAPDWQRSSSLRESADGADSIQE